MKCRYLVRTTTTHLPITDKSRICSHDDPNHWPEQQADNFGQSMSRKIRDKINISFLSFLEKQHGWKERYLDEQP